MNKTANGKRQMTNDKLKVFILHGWAYSKEKWNPFLSLLKSGGLNPYLLSIPGLTEKNDKVWNIDNYVKWLYKILEKEKGKIVLLGHSNGGRIALAFTIKYPQKLSKLILIDSAGVYHNDLPIKIKRGIFKITAKVGKKIFPLEQARNLLYAIARENDYKNADPIMKRTMINLINSDKSLTIDKIKVSTIIIWGEIDKIIPVSDAKILNQKIVNSKLYIINNSRHSPQFTHSEEVADIIIQQLNRAVI